MRYYLLEKVQGLEIGSKPMSISEFAFNDPTDFEKHAALLFKKEGYEVTIPTAPNTRGYDIELQKGVERIAVQVKNHKAKCSVAQVQRFLDFLELPLAAKFTSGWFISASGFYKPALAYVERELPNNLRLGTCSNGVVLWNYPEPPRKPKTGVEPPKLHPELKYIGVFTSKGGVGKTTVAAHLAGAFAEMGHDVILLDLDPDRNLRKLFLQDLDDEQGDASLFVPPPRNKKNQTGAVITVLNHDQWREEEYPDVKVVICDCSPSLPENPKSFIDKFDYCLIPTTLTPLGISKNADIIIRTFKHVREQNKKVEMFALINGYNASKDVEKRNEVLLHHLKRQMSEYTSLDPKCKFIEPEAAKIRYSNSLLYWGYHIVDRTKPQLAFNEICGKSHPRTDFFQLAEYLENHTDIDKLRAHGLHART
jgi:chromosome partitioning protein